MKLVDTNILVYAFDIESEHHIKAKEILKDGLKNSNIVLSSQNLLEFYSVATRKIPVPLSPKDANEVINIIFDTPEIMIIAPSLNCVRNAVKTSEKKNLKGARIFDVVISETMKENGIEVILTEDNHFEKLGVYMDNPFVK
ncbi:MAG: hypothetical protein CVT89_01750 [Candidatus Altiarchaeales archaeon HGW-Altiarchaeales-2]|nr:MAG: hypothetical protein CVT89_01750 [Candidatus Altiarchaeales archaeon HGW-Altiarchaeales-2]